MNSELLKLLSFFYINIYILEAVIMFVFTIGIIRTIYQVKKSEK
ncbi:hypothetical protein [Clostridium baratii]|nr:hypothetical protein [Clostridium baratii]